MIASSSTTRILTGYACVQPAGIDHKAAIARQGLCRQRDTLLALAGLRSNRRIKDRWQGAAAFWRLPHRTGCLQSQLLHRESGTDSAPAPRQKYRHEAWTFL